MSKPLKPQIRFKGYDDEWKQSSFGNVCDVYDGVHQTPHYTSEGVMFVSVEDIKTLHSNKFISPEAYANDFNIVPQRNDILMTRIGDIGTANVVESDEPLAYYVSLALLKSPKLDSYFFKSAISAPDTIAELWKRTLHIAFPKKINKNEISLVGVKHPFTKNEQCEIGEYFRQIDTQIKEAEREVERLEKMKTASLQKMFPRPGATAPEIRFAGFSEPWKILTFKKVYSFLKNNTLSRDCLNYNNGIAKNIHYGDVLIKFGAFVNPLSIEVPFVNPNVTLELSSSYKLDDGDVIFADTAEDETVGKCTEIRGVSDSNVVSGLHTIAVRPNFKFAPYYLGYYHNSNAYHYQLLPLMQGVKVLSINRTAIADTMVVFPSSLDEQKAIGEYFRNLDELIAAKRKSIVKLRNIKKACLSKMFVNDTDQ